MKLSVVTVCYNAEATIGHTIESFLAQDYAEREMVIVDGASRDATLALARSFADPRIVIHSAPDRGLYDAMNRGLALFAGDAVGFLNADDSYSDAGALSAIAEGLATADIVSGNLEFVRDHRSKAVLRYWRGTPYRSGAFRRGWMPAHPTFYARRKVVETVGMFDLSYAIAADYDYMLRAYELNGFTATHINRTFVHMMAGGKSTAGLGAYLKSNIESLKSRRRWLDAGVIDLALFAKPLSKVGQFFVPGGADVIPFDLKGKRVYVAGHRGMVGQALVRRLAPEDCEILTAPREEVDLRRQADVENWFARRRPQAVFLAAAKVGGILANAMYPAQFLYDNLMIEANVIEAARRSGVEKLIVLGSSCIYPRLAPQPIAESALLDGALEPTNEWYAIAKIAGLKLAQSYRREYGCHFISAQPTNLYGPGDNYDLNTSHVLPALLRKAHEARLAGSSSLTVWGSGAPLREFLHVDDLADALVFLIRNYDGDSHINVGSGEEVSIATLARLICETAGFEGTLRFDRSRPDGTPRKLVDSTRLATLGWRRARPLRQGVAETFEDYLRSRAPSDGEQPS